MGHASTQGYPAGLIFNNLTSWICSEDKTPL